MKLLIAGLLYNGINNFSLGIGADPIRDLFSEVLPLKCLCRRKNSNASVAGDAHLFDYFRRA